MRPCKLFIPRTGRYLPGTTSNLSCGGVMLRVAGQSALEPGDSVFLGIAMKRRQAVLPTREMIEARVLRVAQEPGDGVAVAARFGIAEEAAESRRAA